MSALNDALSFLLSHLATFTSDPSVASAAKRHLTAIHNIGGVVEAIDNSPLASVIPAPVKTVLDVVSIAHETVNGVIQPNTGATQAATTPSTGQAPTTTTPPPKTA